MKGSSLAQAGGGNSCARPRCACGHRELRALPPRMELLFLLALGDFHKHLDDFRPELKDGSATRISTIRKSMRFNLDDILCIFAQISLEMK